MNTVKIPEFSRLHLISLWSCKVVPLRRFCWWKNAMGAYFQLPSVVLDRRCLEGNIWVSQVDKVKLPCSSSHSTDNHWRLKIRLNSSISLRRMVVFGEKKLCTFLRCFHPPSRISFIFRTLIYIYRSSSKRQQQQHISHFTTYFPFFTTSLSSSPLALHLLTLMCALCCDDKMMMTMEKILHSRSNLPKASNTQRHTFNSTFVSKLKRRNLLRFWAFQWPKFFIQFLLLYFHPSSTNHCV